MKKVVKIKYICEYCRKSFDDEHTAKDHEESWCYKNPKLRACFTCKSVLDSDYGIKCALGEDIFYGAIRGCKKWEG